MGFSERKCVVINQIRLSPLLEILSFDTDFVFYFYQNSLILARKLSFFQLVIQDLFIFYVV